MGLRGPRSCLHLYHRCVPLTWVPWVPWVRLGQQSDDWKAKIQDLQARALRPDSKGCVEASLPSDVSYEEPQPSLPPWQPQWSTRYISTLLLWYLSEVPEASKLSDFRTCACTQGSPPFLPVGYLWCTLLPKAAVKERTPENVLETPSCLKTRFWRVVQAGHKFKIFQPLSLKGSDYRCILACSPHDIFFYKVNGIKQGVSYTLYQTYVWTLWQCFLKKFRKCYNIFPQ